MAITEQAGSVPPPIHAAWSEAQFTFRMNEVLETHLDIHKVGSMAATSATSALPQRLRRMGASSATQTRGPLAATTVDIDGGDLPPKLGRMGRKPPPLPPTISKSTNGEPAAARVYDGEVKEAQTIDASIDPFGLPPKLQRARRNVPQATTALATGLPPKVRRAWGNVPPPPTAPEATTGTPSSSRATLDEEASHLPTKFRRAHNIPPPSTNLKPAAVGLVSKLKDGGSSQARPVTPRAGPAEIASSAPYLRTMLGALQAHGIIPEAPAPAPVVAAANSKGDDTGSDDEEHEEDEDYSVFAEKVSWKVLCRLIKPARRIAKRIPVQRELRSAAKGKKKEEPTDDGKATESTAAKDKAKAKNISEAMKVAVRAAKRVAEAKAGEQTVSTRRRKAAVKTTIRAKKIVQAKAAGRKPSTRGRGAAKAAVTGNVPTIAGERPPLSASKTHNTPGKSSGHKESESISERLRPAFRLLGTKEVASGKAPGRSTRSAGKSEVPGARDVKTMKPGVGRSKRKEMHEGDHEERDYAKRIKTSEANPMEDEPPRPKLMIRIPKRPTREEIAEGSKAHAEPIQETVENADSKLRRSTRSKKPSFKTRQQ